MQKIPRGIIAIAVVLALTGSVFYWYAVRMFPSAKPDRSVSNVVANKPKEISAVVSYEVPGEKFDHLRFVVTLDATGAIERIQTLDAETNEIPEKKKDFNDEVNVILKGKKLSELSAIDKVGKSTLTTMAFNEALDKLKAQL